MFFCNKVLLTYHCSRWGAACKRQLWRANPAVSCVYVAERPALPVSAVRCPLPTSMSFQMMWRQRPSLVVDQEDALRSSKAHGTRCRRCRYLLEPTAEFPVRSSDFRYPVRPDVFDREAQQLRRRGGTHCRWTEERVDDPKTIEWCLVEEHRDLVRE